MTMNDRATRYAWYYLALSGLSILIFGCAVFDFGFLGSFSPKQSTIVIIVLFTGLTLIQSLFED
jgi:hypothetical protein